MTQPPFTPGWPSPPPSPPPSPQPAAAPPLAEPWLDVRLFEYRIVVLRGFLDHTVATRVTAQLLTLDAAARHRIQLLVDSADGDLAAALVVLDTMDALRVSVHAIAVGEVGGPSLALLTAADRALATPHARLRLSEPRASIVGRGSEVEKQAQQHAALLTAFIDRLSAATGKAAEQIAEDLRAGRFLTAAEAVDYGLIDAVVTKEPG